MKKAIFLLLLILIFIGRTDAIAKEQYTDPVSENINKQDKAKTEKPPNSYIKFEMSGLETEAYGFDMRSWSYGVKLEKNFSRDKLFRTISGFEIGYRKESSELISIGHYINGKIYRSLPFPFEFESRIGMGYEWGFPSYNFDKALFRYENGSLEEYRAVYLQRNSNIPTVEASRDGIGHIFGEFSLSKKTGMVIIEGGVRGTRMTFGYEKYKLENDRVIFYESGDDTKIVPSYFIRLGIKIP